MAAAAPIMMSFSFSFSVALLLLLSSPILTLHAFNVSAECPEILNSSTVKNYKRSSQNLLLVMVPWKVGFKQFVNFSSSNCSFDGFSIQVFLRARALSMQDHQKFEYKFVLHGNGVETTSYEEMVDMVHQGVVDVIVADLTITKERMKKVRFTVPYLASSLVMVTTLRYFGSAETLWDFLKPFSPRLWIVLCGSFVATGFALYLLEYRNPDFLKPRVAPPSRASSSHGRSPSLAAEASAFASASNLSMPYERTDSFASASTSSTPASAQGVPYGQADSLAFAPAPGEIDGTYLPSMDLPPFKVPDPPSMLKPLAYAVFRMPSEESVRTHLGRIVTVMWLFMMVIFISSYTASLTSFVFAQARYPTVQNFQSLLSQTNISIGYQAGSFMNDYLGKIHINKQRLKKFSSTKDYVKALKEGRVGAVLDESPYVQILLQSECFFTKDPTDDDLPSWGGFAFAFQKKHSTLLKEVSKAIVQMYENGELNDLQNSQGINGGTTRESCSFDEESSRMELRSFGGLFIVLGVAYVFCFFLRFFTKAVQSDGEICMNALACVRSGTCQDVKVPISRSSSRVSDARFEHNDVGLEHRNLSLEHGRG